MPTTQIRHQKRGLIGNNSSSSSVGLWPGLRLFVPRCRCVLSPSPCVVSSRRRRSALTWLQSGQNMEKGIAKSGKRKRSSRTGYAQSPETIKKVHAGIASVRSALIMPTFQHTATEKHVRNSRPLSSARLTTMGFTKSPPPKTTPELELKLACYSACHATINSVDHLGELVQPYTACDVKLH